MTARAFFDGLRETLMPTRSRTPFTADSGACTCREIMDREDCTQYEAIHGSDPICPALMHVCHDCGTDVDPIERTHEHVY